MELGFREAEVLVVERVVSFVIADAGEHRHPTHQVVGRRQHLLHPLVLVGALVHDVSEVDLEVGPQCVGEVLELLDDRPVALCVTDRHERERRLRPHRRLERQGFSYEFGAVGVPGADTVKVRGL